MSDNQTGGKGGKKIGREKRHPSHVMYKLHHKQNGHKATHHRTPLEKYLEANR